MYDACDGCASAIFYIGSGTRDGSGSRDSAEKSGKDISESLTDQLGVGVMPVTDHSVGNDAGKQGFDACQQSDRECRREQLTEHGETHMRKCRHRKP